MVADFQKFLSKPKFLRKYVALRNVAVVVAIVWSWQGRADGHEQCSDVCDNGKCADEQYICEAGWKGPQCQWCQGRVRLQDNASVITDGPGNYSTDTQCTWLIDSGQPNTSIRLHLDHFATECSWDHLYIFDGHSIYDPLLAVFSGMVVKDNYRVPNIPELVARSGYALLYFYSNAAYNLTGFSISYSINGCPRTTAGEECSGHGVCLDGFCTCDADWDGPACSVQVCPEGCSGNGECNREEHQCQCHPGYTGADCSQVVQAGWWEAVGHNITNQLIQSDPASALLERSSHTTVLIDDTLWVIGGYSFTEKPFILKYDIRDDRWVAVESTSTKKPMHRYGHTTVVYNGSIYMFGGMKSNGHITRELWQLDTDTLMWSHRVTRRRGGSGGGRPGGGRRGRQGRKERNRRNNRNGKNKDEESGREWEEEELPEEQDLDQKDGREREEEEEEHHEGHHSRNRGDGGGRCLHGAGPCAPIRCVGHASVVVQKATKNVMLVIFGHSSIYGYLNTVQEYHLDDGTWTTVETHGAVVKGVYGHTAVWDPATALVYVHGGMLLHTTSQVTATLMTYEPLEQKWKLQSPAPVPRFLHSAVLFDGLMLVFGGNTHDDTSYFYGAKCYSADFLAYDVSCNAWHALRQPPNLYVDVARYGHTATLHAGAMHLLGGFNGKMLGSLLRYYPGECSRITHAEECLNAFPGRKCVYNRVLERCEPINTSNDSNKAYDMCSNTTPPLNYTELCNEQQSCRSCMFNTYGCTWCGNACTHNKCLEYEGMGEWVSCEDSLRSHCKSLKNCQLCITHQHCDWQEQQCVVARNRTNTPEQLEVSGAVLPGENIPSTPPIDQQDHRTGLCGGSCTAKHPHKACDETCTERKTCSKCTESACVWCFNRQRCISNNSYLVSFPYGQCREWTTEAKKCMDLKPGERRCSLHKACKECQADVACGWCDDGGGTGIGSCMEGGQRGPVNPVTSMLNRNAGNCSAANWFFTECPLCNCNGHSTCDNNSQCLQPCANNTEGPHCQYCSNKFYGSPINGGLCSPCMCNKHGDDCNRETGRCTCHTKGVIGDHCERCDTQNNYNGEPLQGSCFYDLEIDYQFTFNLSSPEDSHIRQINFFNTPTKSDVDIDFHMYCSKVTNIKISSKTTRSHESWIIRNYTGTRIHQRFSASDYSFGSADSNTTFFVYVYNFTPPIEIMVSFSHILIDFFSLFFL